MASAELDSRQLSVIALLSPTDCLELMFQMCDFLRQLAQSVERQEHPDLSENEIAARVSKQIQSANG